MGLKAEVFPEPEFQEGAPGGGESGHLSISQARNTFNDPLTEQLSLQAIWLFVFLSVMGPRVLQELRQ